MILCCGEALIDMIPSTSRTGEACFIPKSGGAVFNTAIALGRLGSDVGLYTGVSDDLFGKLLQAELHASRVKTDHLVSRKAPSTLAFVELTEGQATYTFYAENSADTSLTAADIPQNLEQVRAMFFGGISLCTEPTASTLHSLMRSRSGDCLTMIDPNIRPAFITDEAGYRARLHDMIAHSDILKLSDEDLDWLAPNQPDTAEQLEQLIGERDTLVFVTKGAQGGMAYRGAKCIARAPASAVLVADTIGAGDTFNAGILHLLHARGALNKDFTSNPDSKTVEEALKFAIKVSGVTVSRSGANPPWAHEI
ncbi:carbohydrate kinase family protein [Pseudophaeobacter leonis]|uniref:carbohydrate kinase family protein n=1 Tax=Pseudophaeobacter leonis TaxID=1144477 RepID=UPI0009F3E850|nr:carbohydrate kinase [Pseudophaeobacter leonis]